MSSKREQIMTKAVDLVDASGKPAGLTLSRQRTISVTPDDLPASVVYAVQESVETGPGRGVDPGLGRKTKRTFRLCVEHRVDAEGLAPDAAVDPLLAWTAAQLCTDPTLGGLAYDCKEIGTTWDAVEQDRVYAAARQFFDIEYVTLSNDLTQ